MSNSNSNNDTCRSNIISKDIDIDTCRSNSISNDDTGRQYNSFDDSDTYIDNVSYQYDFLHYRSISVWLAKLQHTDPSCRWWRNQDVDTSSFWNVPVSRL